MTSQVLAPREETTGSVYFLIRGDRIKVGWSANVPQRLATFGDTAEDLLAVAGQAELTDERVAHRYLKKWKIRGEWFRATDECLAAIQRLLDKPACLWDSMVGLTPEQRSMRARVAAHARWAKEDPKPAAQHAQAGLLAKFERQVDPEGKLPDAERLRRAESLRKAHMHRLAFQSSKARKGRAQ